jgi:hypothetical protein
MCLTSACSKNGAATFAPTALNLNAVFPNNRFLSQFGRKVFFSPSNFCSKAKIDENKFEIPRKFSSK